MKSGHGASESTYLLRDLWERRWFCATPSTCGAWVTRSVGCVSCPLASRPPIYSDLWDQTDNELIEAKGLVTREQLRMAVGQLFDYSRCVDTPIGKLKVDAISFT